MIKNNKHKRFALPRNEDLDSTCYQWTDEQIQALNYYLEVRDSLSKNGRMDHDSPITLYRVSYQHREAARVLWIKWIDQGYYLICSQYDDGVLSLFISGFEDEVLKPICDVTLWSEYKDQLDEREGVRR